MRKLKFRSYNSESKEMTQLKTLWLDLVYKHTISIMQSVELPDENGRDVYEGDIVTNDDSDCNLLVVFENGAFCLQPLLLKKTPTANIRHLEFMRIVGNRYENPELIKDFVL